MQDLTDDASMSPVALSTLASGDSLMYGFKKWIKSDPHPTSGHFYIVRLTDGALGELAGTEVVMARPLGFNDV